MKYLNLRKYSNSLYLKKLSRRLSSLMNMNGLLIEKRRKITLKYLILNQFIIQIEIIRSPPYSTGKSVVLFWKQYISIFYCWRVFIFFVWKEVSLLLALWQCIMFYDRYCVWCLLWFNYLNDFYFLSICNRFL